MAPQLMGIKGRSFRRLKAWIARATSSLPVPLSPVTNTGTSEEATFLMVANTCSIWGHWPTIPPNVRFLLFQRALQAAVLILNERGCGMPAR